VSEKNKKSREDVILEQIDKIRGQIGSMTLVCSGTLLRRMKVCGKPTCRCAHDPGARHGPYYEWSRLEEGRLIHRVISPRQAKILRQAIANQRKILRLLRKWGQKSLLLMEAQTMEKG